MKTRFSSQLSLILISAFLLLFSSCDVDVKKSANGKNKDVKIDTPVARLHVSEDADASETGLPVYPGSRLAPKKENGDNDNANLNILTGFFGLKVVAVSYESDDSVEKIKTYYEKQLKQYGDVLECRTTGGNASANFSGDDDDSKAKALTCEQSTGNDFELKAGTHNNQHIVSIEPRDKGCKFSLVYVKMYGKETTI
jgi:hypothetical protein